jgi:hypothetical protein
MTFMPDARLRRRAHPDPPSRTVPATPAPAAFRKSLRVRVLFTPPSPGCAPEAIIVIDERPGYAGMPVRDSRTVELPRYFQRQRSHARMPTTGEIGETAMAKRRRFVPGHSRMRVTGASFAEEPAVGAFWLRVVGRLPDDR